MAVAVGCSIKGTLGVEEGGGEIEEMLGGREKRDGGSTVGLGAGDVESRGEEGSRIG